MQIKYAIIFSFFCLFSCKSDPTSSLMDLDLMSKGIPLKIKAPEGAIVVADDMGVMKDVTVKKGTDFFLQILASGAVSIDKKKIMAQEKATVQAGPFFSKLIQEDDFGFIFEKQIDSTTFNHDFRYVKIQGDQEYLFQTGMIGKFSLEDVKTMYAAVQ